MVTKESIKRLTCCQTLFNF